MVMSVSYGERALESELEMNDMKWHEMTKYLASFIHCVLEDDLPRDFHFLLQSAPDGASINSKFLQ